MRVLIKVEQTGHLEALEFRMAAVAILSDLTILFPARKWPK